MSTFSVKADCKTYLASEVSKQAFLDHYVTILTDYINATPDYTEEKGKTYLLDVFRKDCIAAFPKFVTDSSKEAKANYTQEQLNWLKYYDRRRKTEFAVMFPPVKAEFDLLAEWNKLVKKAIAAGQGAEFDKQAVKYATPIIAEFMKQEQ